MVVTGLLQDRPDLPREPVGRSVARLRVNGAKHGSTPTLPECHPDRPIARAKLVLSAFKPRAGDDPPLSKRPGNSNTADWGQQEQQFDVHAASRTPERAWPCSDYHSAVLDEGDTPVPGHTHSTGQHGASGPYLFFLLGAPSAGDER